MEARNALRPGDAKRLRPSQIDHIRAKESNSLLFYYLSSTITNMNKTHYEDPNPCRNGHRAPRLVSTGACTACTSDAQKRWKANPENRARMNAYENERRRKLGWTNPAQRARQRRYDRKRMGLPDPTRPCPEYCENCNRAVPNGFGMHLDHCHVTGKFRGWLCNRCNRGLGYFDDCIEGLERALAYLRRA